LEAPVASPDAQDEGIGAALVDTIESPTATDPLGHTEEEELYEGLAAAIRSLSERERVLLSLYYEQELTMKEISQVLEVSESRVCQLHSRALHRLRGHLGSLVSAA
jgi:RNA polymerase sigma factor for flagellar operon FliA